jgi:hypothetical protein
MVLLERLLILWQPKLLPVSGLTLSQVGIYFLLKGREVVNHRLMGQRMNKNTRTLETKLKLKAS